MIDIKKIMKDLNQANYMLFEKYHLDDAIKALEQQQAEISELKTIITCKDELLKVKDLDVKARDEVIDRVKNTISSLKRDEARAEYDVAYNNAMSTCLYYINEAVEELLNIGE